MIGAIVADFFGAERTTLGKYVTQEAAVLRFDHTWAAILVASLIGILFYSIVILAERWLVPWAQEGGE
jgi:NitT/TauT family transport system permease protein